MCSFKVIKCSHSRDDKYDKVKRGNVVLLQYYGIIIQTKASV